MVGTIGSDGTLDFRHDPCFTDDDFFEANQIRAETLPLDILIAKDGATTGKVGLVSPGFDVEKCLINEHTFRLRVGDMLPGDDVSPPDEMEALRELNTWYIFFFLKS